MVVKTISNKFYKFIVSFFLITLVILGTSLVNAVDNWPMFRHDSTHTGFSSSLAPNSENIIWDNTETGRIHSSPSVVDGFIYIGSDNDNIYCLDATTGEIEWDTLLDGDVVSSPAVFNGYVYVGSWNGMFYRLSARTGQIDWSKSIGTGFQSSPVVANNKVYIGSNYGGGGGNISCLDIESGNIIWSNITYSLLGYNSPTIDNNLVYIASSQGFIFCFDALTGKQKWMKMPGGTIESSPTVSNGNLYIGIGSDVFCLDATHGNTVWSNTTGGSIFSSPAISGGKLYIGSGDSKIYCFDATDGSKIWSSTTGDTISSSPAVADDKVYVGSNDGRLYCFDATDGNLSWKSSVLDDVIFSSPAIADGKVIIGTKGSSPSEGSVVCFRGNNPPETPNQPDGSNEGFAEEQYSYTVTTTVDPDGDDVKYLFDWGDGSDSGWKEAPSATHTWSNEGNYEVRVKAKDVYDLESDWSPILNVVTAPSLPALLISCQTSVVEENNFEVTITSEDNPIENVNVEFNEAEKTTDTNGKATFTAPEVDQSTHYTITANKEGYKEDVATIIVLNQKESKGWFYGIVYDTSTSLLLENVRIQISGETKSWSTYTSEDGEYILSVPSGIYTITASKNGYETGSKNNITVDNRSAVEVNIILESTEIKQSTGVVDYLIQNQIKEGRISAEIDPEELHVTLYSDEIDVNITQVKELSKGGISFIIAGEGTGTIIAVYLKVSDEEELVVTYDGEEINETTDLESFFNNNNTESVYTILPSSSSENVLCILIPEFSEHTVTITSVVEALGGPTMILIYLITCIVVAFVFISNVIRRIIARRRYLRKK